MIKLGKGRYSEVFLVIEEQHDHQNQNKKELKLYALKRPVVTQESQQIIREYEILKNIVHDHIVEIYDIKKEDPQSTLIMKPYIGGSLHDFIRKYNSNSLISKVYLENVRIFMSQLFSALIYLKNKNIVHRDIKASNCLLDIISQSNNSYIVKLKLVDFGCSMLQSDTIGSQFGGTIHTISPEEVSGFIFKDYRSDWWSAGILLYEMLVGHFPQFLHVKKFLTSSSESTIFPSSRDMTIATRALIEYNSLVHRNSISIPENGSMQSAAAESNFDKDKHIEIEEVVKSWFVDSVNEIPCIIQELSSYSETQYEHSGNDNVSLEKLLAIAAKKERAEDAVYLIRMLTHSNIIIKALLAVHPDYRLGVDKLTDASTYQLELYDALKVIESTVHGNDTINTFNLFSDITTACREFCIDINPAINRNFIVDKSLGFFDIIEAFLINCSSHLNLPTTAEEDKAFTDF